LLSTAAGGMELFMAKTANYIAILKLNQKQDIRFVVNKFMKVFAFWLT